MVIYMIILTVRSDC